MDIIKANEHNSLDKFHHSLSLSTYPNKYVPIVDPIPRLKELILEGCLSNSNNTLLEAFHNSNDTKLHQLWLLTRIALNQWRVFNDQTCISHLRARIIQRLPMPSEHPHIKDKPREPQHRGG
jgi:hypothetical protein